MLSQARYEETDAAAAAKVALALDSLNEALALVTDASERATLRARFALVIIEHADHEDGLRKNVLKLAQDALMLSHRGTAGPHPPIVVFLQDLMQRGRCCWTEDAGNAVAMAGMGLCNVTRANEIVLEANEDDGEKDDDEDDSPLTEEQEQALWWLIEGTRLADRVHTFVAFPLTFARWMWPPPPSACTWLKAAVKALGPNAEAATRARYLCWVRWQHSEPPRTTPCVLTPSPCLLCASSLAKRGSHAETSARATTRTSKRAAPSKQRSRPMRPAFPKACTSFWRSTSRGALAPRRERVCTDVCYRAPHAATCGGAAGGDACGAPQAGWPHAGAPQAGMLGKVDVGVVERCQKPAWTRRSDGTKSVGWGWVWRG